MKVKLAFAVALSHGAELLILDEATSGLDPIVRDEVLDLLLDFVQDERHGVLVSSHITSDLEKVADYITFLHQGKLVFTLEKDLLVDQYGVLHCGAAVFDTLDPADILAWRREAYQYKVLVRDRYQAELPVMCSMESDTRHSPPASRRMASWRCSGLSPGQYFSARSQMAACFSASSSKYGSGRRR